MIAGATDASAARLEQVLGNWDGSGEGGKSRRAPSVDKLPHAPGIREPELVKPPEPRCRVALEAAGGALRGWVQVAVRDIVEEEECVLRGAAGREQRANLASHPAKSEQDLARVAFLHMHTHTHTHTRTDTADAPLFSPASFPWKDSSRGNY